MSQDKFVDVTIAGSGIAGLTAAIYAGRANLNSLVLEGAMPGGLLTTTTDVENFPGFPEGIQGPDLTENTKKQAKRFGVNFKYGLIESCDFSKRPFLLTLDDRSVVETKSLIIATGSSPKFLGLESESKYLGYGLSTCATCDGFFFKDKNVVVVGGGDTAMEEGLFLTKYARNVMILHRRDYFRASSIMKKKAHQNPKITISTNVIVREILGSEGKVSGVLIEDVKNKNKESIDCDGVFIAIGHKPNIEPFVNKLNMDSNRYIITKEGTTETSVLGVFACGDVQDHIYRQAVTAAGTGCMAALDAARFLESGL